jgi:gamma-aminobutyric acid type B receptor
MSSPFFNNIILLGCLLGYVQLFVSAEDLARAAGPAFGKLCVARVVLLSVGFTLMFGGLFAKTYRVYVIFTRKQMQVMKMKDERLLLTVLLLLLLDALLLLTWFLTEPPARLEAVGQPYMVTEDLWRQDASVSCSSEHYRLFTTINLVYKGAVMLGGAFLAIQTRAVRIPALNDSREIGMAIYTVALVSTLVFSVNGFVADVNALAILEAAALFFNTTATMAFLFALKLLQVHRGVGDEGTRSVASNNTTQFATRPPSAVRQVSAENVSLSSMDPPSKTEAS